MEISIAIIEWINKNDGFIMCLLTLIYVVTTIFIWLLNKKSTRLSEEQIREAQLALKMNIDMQLYDKRLSIANKIENEDYSNTVMEIRLLYGNEILLKIKKIQSLTKDLKSYRSDLETFYKLSEYQYELEYNEKYKNGDIEITFGEYCMEQPLQDFVDNPYYDENNDLQYDTYYLSEIQENLSMCEKTLKELKLDLKKNVLNILETTYTNYSI